MTYVIIAAYHEHAQSRCALDVASIEATNETVAVTRYCNEQRAARRSVGAYVVLTGVAAAELVEALARRMDDDRPSDPQEAAAFDAIVNSINSRRRLG